MITYEELKNELNAFLDGSGKRIIDNNTDTSPDLDDVTNGSDIYPIVERLNWDNIQPNLEYLEEISLLRDTVMNIPEDKELIVYNLDDTVKEFGLVKGWYLDTPRKRFRYTIHKLMGGRTNWYASSCVIFIIEKDLKRYY